MKGLFFSSLIGISTFLLPTLVYSKEFPSSYFNIAKKIDCSPITKLSYTDEKSYIDVEFGDNNKYKGAFWCNNLGDKKYKYLLIIICNSTNSDFKIIRWGNYPRPLSVFDRTEKISGEFYSASNHKKTIFKNLNITGKAIMSSFDGVEEIFFEKKGEWYYTVRH